MFENLKNEDDSNKAEWTNVILLALAIFMGGNSYFVKSEVQTNKYLMEKKIEKMESYIENNKDTKNITILMDKRLVIVEENQKYLKDLITEMKSMRKDITDIKIAIK